MNSSNAHPYRVGNSAQRMPLTPQKHHLLLPLSNVQVPAVKIQSGRNLITLLIAINLNYVNTKVNTKLLGNLRAMKPVNELPVLIFSNGNKHPKLLDAVLQRRVSCGLKCWK